MKTIEQILKSKSVYLNDWSESKKEGLMGDFDNPKLKSKKILFATYSYQDYSGDAFVLFSEGGKLFEVNGSHCSCYGLEGQWEPEEVVLKELENRVTVGTFGGNSYCGNEFNSELKKFLGI